MRDASARNSALSLCGTRFAFSLNHKIRGTGRRNRRLNSGRYVMRKYFSWTVPAALAAGILGATPVFADPILWISDTAGNIGQVDIATGSVVAGWVYNTGL